MIKIENVDIYGWEAAIRGMRNPMNSWDISDSKMMWAEDPSYMDIGRPDLAMHMVVGENDLRLMKSLAEAGNDHGKFMRMINVTLDIVAPLYWWKEFDTYKVGTVADSCSTMHKIHSKPIELSDFSIDNCTVEDLGICLELTDFFLNVIADCELLRQKFLATNDKKYWKALIQLLPTGYNQRRTVQLNYAVLKNIYHARKNHKLDEWRDFCKWIESLPYSEIICG